MVFVLNVRLPLKSALSISCTQVLKGGSIMCNGRGETNTLEVIPKDYHFVICLRYECECVRGFVSDSL